MKIDKIFGRHFHHLPAAISPTQFDFCSPYSLPRMHLGPNVDKSRAIDIQLGTQAIPNDLAVLFEHGDSASVERKSKFAHSGPTTPSKNILNWKQTTRSAQHNANCLANNDALPCHSAYSRNSLPFIHRRRPKRYLFWRTEWTNERTNEREKSQNELHAHRHRQGKWKFKNGNIWQCSSAAFMISNTWCTQSMLHMYYAYALRKRPREPERESGRERVREKQKDRSDNVRAFHYMRFIRIRINNLMVSTRA